MEELPPHNVQKAERNILDNHVIMIITGTASTAWKCEKYPKCKFFYRGEFPFSAEAEG